jgi:ACS family tartrate transporter-like MFS transporter
VNHIGAAHTLRCRQRDGEHDIDTKRLDIDIGRAAMTKVMWRIVPLVLVAYLMAYMDRVNISFASLQMNDALKFSASIYGLGAGFFFLAYAIFEVPSSLMLQRYSAPQWIARIMITWGMLAASMMFVRTPMQFYIMRFLLGAAEAGFFPSVIYYFSSWFPMAWRGRAISRIYIASSLASVVMGSISAALLGLDGRGGLQGWQWLFLVQGLPAALMGLLLLWALPRTPLAAHWLTVPEKTWIERELARDAALIGVPVRHNVWRNITNPTVLQFGAIGIVLNLFGTCLVLFAPAVLSARAGLDTHAIGHLVTGGGMLGVLGVLFVGWNSDRHGDRLHDAFICTLICMSGLILITVAPTPTLVMVGYLMFAATWFSSGVLTISSWADVLHPQQLAVGGAAINTLWQVGAFLSPYGFGLAKDATGGFTLGLIGSAVVAGVQALLILYVRARVASNRRARQRIANEPDALTP